MPSTAVETQTPNLRTQAPTVRPVQKSPLTLRQIQQGTKLLDLLSLVFLTIGWLSLNGLNLPQMTVSSALPWLAYPCICFWSIKLARGYRMIASRRVITQLKRVLSAIAMGQVIFAIWVLAAFDNKVLLDTFPLMLVGVFLLAGLHTYYAGLIKHFVRTGRLSTNVVIVGATERAQKLIKRNQQSHDLNILGMFDDRIDRVPNMIEGVPLLGRLDDLLMWDRLPEVDRIVVTVTSDARTRVRQLIDRLRVLPNQIVLLLDLEGFAPESETLAEIAHSPAAFVSGTPEDARRAFAKRVADLAFATLMLIGFAPIMLILAVLIKLDSPGPVLFRQKRHGFKNQIIKVWKFRSMRDDPAAALRMKTQTTADDPRVTKIGRFIRATSLDELPQLFNVVMGTMSIVGPRPHAIGMTSENTDVQAIVRDYAHRHRMKPGITGWAQINGSRGPVPTKELVRERVRLDMEYINRASFWFDLYIMIMTAPVLLGDKHAQR